VRHPDLPQSLEAGSIHQSAVWSFPFLGDDHEGSGTIGPDELQRFSIFLVFVAGFSVKILKDVTARELRTVRARTTASQLADAADFYFAFRFSDIPITCYITRRATWTSAFNHFTAGSAKSATTANLMF
jgi:hypothetical protein